MTTRNYSNIAVLTTLNGAINDTVDTLDVDSATGYPAAPFVIKLDTEAIKVGAKASLTFSSLERGYDGTTAASHIDATEVEHVVVATDIGAVGGLDVTLTNPVDGDGIVVRGEGYVNERVISAEGGGTLVHLSTHEPSAASSVDIGLPAGYAGFKILATLEVATGTAVVVELQMGGGTIDTGSNYDWARGFHGDSSGEAAGDSQTEINIGYMYDTRKHIVSIEVGAGYDDASEFTDVFSHNLTMDTTQQFNRFHGGTYLTNAAVDILRLQPATSTFTGTIHVYGYAIEGGGALFSSFSPILDHKPTTDTLDDEFDSTTLDGKWTAVTGTSGTVDMVEVGEVEKYDLTTRPGWLLMQAGSAADQKVQLRQDLTLADGDSVTIALSPTVSSDADTGIADNEMVVGISLNDNDTGYDAGEFNYLGVQFGATLARVSHWDGTTTHGASAPFTGGHHTIPMAGRLYLRWNRVGSVVHGFTSTDGTTWMALGSETRSATATNIWIFAESVVAATEPVPVQAVDWIRQGTNGLDPWSHSGLIQLDSVPEWMTYLNHRVSGETAHADDDFFNDGVLSSDWTTLTVTGAQTITEFRGMLSIRITTGQTVSDLNAILRPVTPSIGDVIETRVHGAQTNTGGSNDLNFAGLVFSDGVIASSNAACLTVHKDAATAGHGWLTASRIGTFTSATIGGISVTWRNPAEPVYIRLEYDAANTWRSFISPDGVSWHDLGTQADTLTPTHVGLVWSTWGDTADGQIVGYDYFRYNGV